MPDLKPDHLIVRYLSNEATSAEQEKLFEWVSRNQENQKIFNDYINLWSVQNKNNNPFNVQKNLLKLNDRIDEFEQTEEKKTIFWNRWNIAAAVILLIVAGFALFHNGIFAYEKHIESLLTEVKTLDQINKVKLSDGTILTLNKNSVLKYPKAFVANTREVYLTGEAFFEVAKNPLKPFIIHANGTTTTVLGTSFNVNASGNGVVVTVATGSVNVSNGEQSHILKPNEKLTYENKIFRKESSDLSEFDWNARVLDFNDVSLSGAAEMISEYYEVTVVFEREPLKQCLITGKFKNQKLETVLNAIEFSTDVQYKIQNDTILFHGKGCQ